MIPTIDRGAGVFETVLMLQGRVVDRDAHLERLARSVEALFGMALPGTLAAALSDLPVHPAARVRVTAWPEAGSLATGLEVEPVAPPGAAPALDLVPVTAAGGLGCHKWRDRSWLEELRRAQPWTPASELLLLDSDGEVLETERAAVLLIEGRRLVAAPDDERRLPSLTRRRLLAAAGEIGLEAAVERIGFERLLAADGVLAASSIRLLAQGGRCGSHAWPEGPAGRPAEVVAALREALVRSAWASFRAGTAPWSA